MSSDYRRDVDLQPTLRVLPAADETDVVALVLHGGRSRSTEPTNPRQLAFRRMVPIARAISRAAGHHGTAVWLLRNRLRGWNEPALDAVTDAEWAMRQLRLRHPDARIVLVGHSMGGRVALRLAGESGVLGVCALAPWVSPGEPIEQLSGRTVVIAHGDRDRWVDPAASRDYAIRARRAGINICRFEVGSSGHSMLRRAGDWTGLVCAFAGGLAGAASPHPAIVNGLRTPAPQGLSLPLPAGVWS